MDSSIHSRSCKLTSFQADSDFANGWLCAWNYTMSRIWGETSSINAICTSTILQLYTFPQISVVFFCLQNSSWQLVGWIPSVPLFRCYNWNIKRKLMGPGSWQCDCRAKTRLCCYHVPWSAATLHTLRAALCCSTIHLHECGNLGSWLLVQSGKHIL